MSWQVSVPNSCANKDIPWYSRFTRFSGFYHFSKSSDFVADFDYLMQNVRANGAIRKIAIKALFFAAL